MSALRPAVLGIMVVGILAHEVRAEPISWPGWLAFIVNQTQPGNGNRLSGHASAPIAPSQPITYSPLTPIYAEPQPIIANAPVNGGLIATPLAMSAVAPPAVAAVPAIPSAAAAAPVDAFINLGAGPYPGRPALPREMPSRGTTVLRSPPFSVVSPRHNSNKISTTRFFSAFSRRSAKVAYRSH